MQKLAFRALALACAFGLAATAAHAVPQFPVDDLTKMPDQNLDGASAMALFKSMMMDEQLDATEKAVEQFRQEKSKTALGEWKLSHFYDALKGQIKDPRLEPLLAKWTQRFPQSPTPKIIKAHFLFLDAINDTGQQGFNDKPAQATNYQAAKLKALSDYLDEIKPAVAARDPQWYVLRARTDMLMDADPIAFLGNAMTGLKQEPTFVALQDAGTDYFAGNSRDLERWARLMQQTLGDAPGTGGAYALAYWRAYNEAYHADMRRNSDIDWDDFTKSAAALVRDYPDPQNVGRMALMTCSGADRAATKQLIGMGRGPLAFYPWASLQQQKVCAQWAAAPAWVGAYEWLMQWIDRDHAQLAQYGPMSFRRRSASR
jgi:hypothetical protein